MTTLNDELMATLKKAGIHSPDQIEELVMDSMFLEALKGAGVDNWQGYEVAQELFMEMESDA